MIMASDFGGMNNARLDALVRDIGSDVEGPMGFWEFTVNGCRLYCITDESHDRMRIMTPIATRDEISDQQFLCCMEANYDRALDARYCVNGDTLWGAFMHPLSSLRPDLFRSACHQVAEIARNFGGSYSSGELRFGSE